VFSWTIDRRLQPTQFLHDIMLCGSPAMRSKGNQGKLQQTVMFLFALPYALHVQAPNGQP
jgi:hypothetical protein